MLKSLILAGALMAPAIAFAQPAAQGPYLSGNVGVGALDGPLLSAHSTTRVNTDAGPAGSVALGWRFADGVRAEVQGNYQTNGVNGINTLRGNGLMEPLANVTGGSSTYSAMANVAYDFPDRFMGARFYVGGGAGYGWLNLGDVHGNGFGSFRLPQNNIFTGADNVDFGTAGALAYQAFVGAAWPLGRVPGLELTAEYRFFGTAREDVPVSRVALGNNIVNGVIPSSYVHDGFTLQDSIISFGVRYRLGSQ
jgi:OOP family OmpA-OmpF porin